MPRAQYHRFSRRLDGIQALPNWPAGFALRPFIPARSARPVHRLLEEAYATGGGSVPDFQAWWSWLSADDEYDPALVVTVFDPAGELAGVAICWTTAFVKDLAVARAHRRRGLATRLLQHAFATFHRRGAPAVDLKVDVDNPAAISLDHSVGMELVRGPSN